jgi:hypothetical protein
MSEENTEQQPVEVVVGAADSIVQKAIKVTETIPVQWKVGDIFAQADKNLGDVAIIRGDNTCDFLKGQEYFLLEINKDTKELSICGSRGDKAGVSTMLEFNNARKIGELTWNILVEE